MKNDIVALDAIFDQIDALTFEKWQKIPLSQRDELAKLKKKMITSSNQEEALAGLILHWALLSLKTREIDFLNSEDNSND